jgi:sugar phosphate isomerase/epimerase
MNSSDRREFLKKSATCCTAALLAGPCSRMLYAAAPSPRIRMRLGLCTYLWGKDWDLPTLIANCEKADVLGVELRVEHKHGVGLQLNQDQRKAVRKRFADSRVTLVGLGTNECFDSPDPVKLARSLENAKQFVRLSRDCGGSGVKVNPNDFHKEVARDKTIAQIGKSLNELGRFAADFGQQIRLEVHGSCCELPTIKRIIDVADHPNVTVCWNSNPKDLDGKGLEYNFNLVKDRLGATVHVRELNMRTYPFAQLLALLGKADYSGWILLECHTSLKDPVAALVQQREVFEQMVGPRQVTVQE